MMSEGKRSVQNDIYVACIWCIEVFLLDSLWTIIKHEKILKKTGGFEMCYISGKSSRKIVHHASCTYVKRISDEYKKNYHTLKEAIQVGYTQCKCCNHIQKYLRKEQNSLDSYCKKKGIFFTLNQDDGTIDIISRTGKWKILVHGQNGFICPVTRRHLICNRIRGRFSFQKEAIKNGNCII